MDELTRSLRSLAERGDHRGAGEVLDAAHDTPTPRRRPALVLAAVAILAVAAIAGSLLIHRSPDASDVIAAASVSVVAPSVDTITTPVVGVRGVLVGTRGTGIASSADLGRTWSDVHLSTE